MSWLPEVEELEELVEELVEEVDLSSDSDLDLSPPTTDGLVFLLWQCRRQEWCRTIRHCQDRRSVNQIQDVTR